MSKFTLAGGISRERGDSDSIFLQYYNVASSWSQVDMGRAQIEHVLYWIIHYTQNNREFCWGEQESLLEACVTAHNITSKSFVKCNPLSYPLGGLKSQNHRMEGNSKRILSNLLVLWVEKFRPRKVK